LLNAPYTMNEFKLKYQQDLDDIVSYAYGYYRTSHTAFIARKPIVLILFFLLAAYSCYPYILNGETVPYQLIIGFATLLLFLLTFRVKWVFRVLYWHKFTQKAILKSMGDIEIMLDEQKVSAASDHKNGECKWSDFKFYIDDKKHFFLYHNENSGLIIPKRIFLLDQEQYDVKSFIERKLAENKSEM